GGGPPGRRDDGLLGAVGVVAAIGRGVRLLGGVLRLLGGVGGLLGGVGQILATGHVVGTLHLAGDLRARVGGGIGGLGGGLGGLGGNHVAGGGGIGGGLLRLGGRVGGLLGGVGSLVGVAARRQAGSQREREKGLGNVHGISCTRRPVRRRGPICAKPCSRCANLPATAAVAFSFGPETTPLRPPRAEPPVRRRSWDAGRRGAGRVAGRGCPTATWRRMRRGPRKARRPGASHRGVLVFRGWLRPSVDVEERAQLLGAARVAQLAQRLGLDLADALAGDIELLAHFLEGVVGVH